MLTIPGMPDVDIIVTDDEGSAVLIGEIKPLGFDKKSKKQLATFARAVHPEFVMGIDPREIVIAKIQNGVPDWRRSLTFSTEKIHRFYNPKSERMSVERFYLEGLVQAWLRDYSFGWKSSRPPGYKELNQIGLASRLR